MFDTEYQKDGGVHASLALNLRTLRIARHMSISQLARASAISKATLSGIERAHANPTVDTLATLAGVLGVSLGELLEGAESGEMRIVRGAMAEPIPAQRPGMRSLETLTSAGELEISELQLPGGCVHKPPPGRQGSRSGVFVLQGKLIAGPAERISELSRGDYASFPTDVPHLYETTRAPARALLISH